MHLSIQVHIKRPHWPHKKAKSSQSANSKSKCNQIPDHTPQSHTAERSEEANYTQTSSQAQKQQPLSPTTTQQPAEQHQEPQHKHHYHPQTQTQILPNIDYKTLKHISYQKRLSQQEQWSREYVPFIPSSPQSQSQNPTSTSGSEKETETEPDSPLHKETIPGMGFEGGWQWSSLSGATTASQNISPSRSISASPISKHQQLQQGEEEREREREKEQDRPRQDSGISLNLNPNLNLNLDTANLPNPNPERPHHRTGFRIEKPDTADTEPEPWVARQRSVTRRASYDIFVDEAERGFLDDGVVV